MEADTITIAVAGPEGAGKTEYCERFSKQIINSVSRTSGLNFSKGRVQRIVLELIMGLEKIVTSSMFRIRPKDDIILDSCFIDSEVYGHLWSLKTGSSLPLIICRLVNKVAYRPDIIHQLMVEPTKATPKNYDMDDMNMLNDLYTFVLKLNGYRQYNMKKYDRGVLVIWRRDDETTTIVRRRI